MPGLDKSQFINWSESDDELLCGICLSVLDNPMVTQCCRQTYCRDCITQWIQTSSTCPNDRKTLTIGNLSQPSRSLINILNKLRMKCEFRSIGCNDDVLYVRYKSHTRDCKYNPEAICGDCGEKNGKRTEHNCVQLLIMKNKQLETVIKELNEKNGLLETKIVNNKKSSAKTIQKLEIEKRDILDENDSYCLSRNRLLAELKNRDTENVNGLNAFMEQITGLKNVMLKMENSLAVKLNEMKPINKSFQVTIKDIDTFFDCFKTVNEPVINDFGYEWKISVTNRPFLTLFLNYHRISSYVIWTKLNVEFSIIRQSINGQNCKITIDDSIDMHSFEDYDGEYDFIIGAHKIFDASNHYIKDNSIILNLTFSSDN